MMTLLPKIVLQKEKGETPLACVERFRAENPAYQRAPMTYAGRLDPIATGELLVLTGDECKKKDEYLGMDKEYEARVLLGFETDSYDILGLSYKREEETDDMSAEKILNDMTGKFAQSYPPYSSKTVNGRQLHDYARAGEIDSIEIPTKEVEIYKVDDISSSEVARDDLLKEILETIDLVQGDFRQEDIKNSWQNLLEKYDISYKFKVLSFTVKVSSGTYIRSIAHRLGGALLSLHRTKIIEK